MCLFDLRQKAESEVGRKERSLSGCCTSAALGCLAASVASGPFPVRVQTWTSLRKLQGAAGGVAEVWTVRGWLAWPGCCVAEAGPRPPGAVPTPQDSASAEQWGHF